MFRVGMKVAQIAPWRETDTGHPDVRFTSCGHVYTIREIVLVAGKWGALLFDELVNPVRDYSIGRMEQPFPIWNFRPLTSPKQQVSFTTGAPVDSERWDNRVKRKPQKAITALQS